MRLPLFIAFRYLFAKKSHNVINVISAISAAGMALGTAALVVILSVYNGFESLVSKTLSNVEPDVLVVPSQGKVFVPEGEAFDWVYENEDVFNMCSVLQETAFASYEGRQTVVNVKGVDAVYETESKLESTLVSGEFSLHCGELCFAVVGSGVAKNLGINTARFEKLDIYYPDRSRNISIANPMSTVDVVSLRPVGVVSVNPDVDADLVIVPIETMRELLEYDREVSAVEIRLREGVDIPSFCKELESRLGDGFKVKDRFHQNETVYRMMKYEKASVFLILIFVIIIISLSVLSSITMLVIEKKEDMKTFYSLGADKSMIRGIFVLEGWMISLFGMGVGLILGIGLALFQQYTGFVSMPGGFIQSAYPVVMNAGDIALIALGVALIGLIAAVLPAKFKED